MDGFDTREQFILYECIMLVINEEVSDYSETMIWHIETVVADVLGVLNNINNTSRRFSSSCEDKIRVSLRSKISQEIRRVRLFREIRSDQVIEVLQEVQKTINEMR